MKKIAVGIVISLVVIAVLLAATNKLPRAQAEEDKGAGIAAKMDEVLKAQQEVMNSLNDIKEELKIIKIRVTQMQ